MQEGDRRFESSGTDLESIRAREYGALRDRARFVVGDWAAGLRGGYHLPTQTEQKQAEDDDEDEPPRAAALTVSA